MERFARSRTMEEIQQEGVPALFPSNLLERLHLAVGDKVRIIDPYINIFPCVIVGQYSGGRSFSIHGGKIPWTHSPSESILISLSSLESILGSHTKYTVAHFTLDPTKNRELTQFREEMEKIMQASGAGTGDLRFMIWDEELKVVVSQLDKNLSLLRGALPGGDGSVSPDRSRFVFLAPPASDQGGRHHARAGNHQGCCPAGVDH